MLFRRGDSFSCYRTVTQCYLDVEFNRVKLNSGFSDDTAMVEALVGLLSICSVAQLRGLLLILRRCRPTFICALPTEIAAQIIAYFEPRDRDVHLLVNQNNDRYWEARCQELQIEMPRTRKSTVSKVSLC